ncbi:MAG: dihydropteroate synthase [Endomicrobiaceae bacterium]|nr:dihydropteroate synthase [Endomicrobiaceae bacterium]
MIVRKTLARNTDEALQIIKTTGCHKFAHKKLPKKMIGNIIVIDDIDNRAANILKQESLSCGTDSSIDEDISRFKNGTSKVVLFGTTVQIEMLISKLKEQPFGLKDLAVKLQDLLKQKEIKNIVCGNKKITVGKKALVMGIVNLSPDSFYGDGTTDEKLLLSKALDMQEYGADIIDVGAESSRPGSKPISEKEEINRIGKLLKLLRKRTKLPISVDTYKPSVAQVAINEGADIINDIYALGYNKKMAEVIAKNKVGVILMHMQGNPLIMQKNIKYEDVILDIFKFLSDRVDFAVKNGINKNSIMIDPGIGFGKTVENNLLIIKKLTEFKTLGLPLVAGLSNKNFLSKIINVEEIKERFFANIAANIIAVANGADIIRVHNVKEIVQTLKFFNAVGSV